MDLSDVKSESLDPNYSVLLNGRVIESKEKSFGAYIGKKSMLEVEIVLERKLTNHFLQTFLPSMMLCLASTGSLFIPSHIVPGRMGLAITSFLSLISLFNGSTTYEKNPNSLKKSNALDFRQDWIKCSYLRAIDVWIILCYVNVFTTLVEYCIVLYLTKGKEMELVKVGNGRWATKSGTDTKNLATAWKIEQIFRVIMPLYNFLFFTIFVIVCETFSAT